MQIPFMGLFLTKVSYIYFTLVNYKLDFQESLYWLSEEQAKDGSTQADYAKTNGT